jgi:hypothetical protein
VAELALAREHGVILHPEMRVSSVTSRSKSRSRSGSDGGVMEVNIQGVQCSGTAGGAFQVKTQGSIDGCIHASAVIVAAGQEMDEPTKRLLSAGSGTVLVCTGTSSHGSEEHSGAPGPVLPGPRSAQSTFYFAGGDCVTQAGGTVVSAIADGKRAAELIAQRRGDLPEKPPRYDEADGALAMSFCGMHYDNPFCLSSSPVTDTAEMIAEAYEAGWGGAWFKTLNRDDKFKVSHPSPRLGAVHASASVSSRMGVGLQNLEQISHRPLGDNLRDIEFLRMHYPRAVTGVSIMGFEEEDWAYLAAAAEVSVLAVLDVLAVLAVLASVCLSPYIVRAHTSPLNTNTADFSACVACFAAATTESGRPHLGVELLVPPDGQERCGAPRGAGLRPHHAVHRGGQKSRQHPRHRQDDA